MDQMEPKHATGVRLEESFLCVSTNQGTDRIRYSEKEELNKSPSELDTADKEQENSHSGIRS